MAIPGSPDCTDLIFDSTIARALTLRSDMAISDALVKLGQKELLIDTQGNWGNPITGDSPAAARYIEARLTKFAKEVLFNGDVTEY